MWLPRWSRCARGACRFYCLLHFKLVGSRRETVDGPSNSSPQNPADIHNETLHELICRSRAVLVRVDQLRQREYTLTTLVNFNGTNGAFPEAGLIADGIGNLFGTTNQGGVSNDGTVFEVASGTHAVSTLVVFNGANGASPAAGLIADGSGNLYGTTSGFGVTITNSTVFKVAVGTHAPSTLATFSNSAVGTRVRSGLISDASGNLYGTAELGGPFMPSGSSNNGTVSKWPPALMPSLPLPHLTIRTERAPRPA